MMDVDHPGLYHHNPAREERRVNPPTFNNTVSRLRAYNQVVAFRAIGRRRRKLAERQQRGTAAGTPMDNQNRVANYHKQNGSERLTPRQARRVDKKARRQAVRLGENWRGGR